LSLDFEFTPERCRSTACTRMAAASREAADELMAREQARRRMSTSAEATSARSALTRDGDDDARVAHHLVSGIACAPATLASRMLGDWVSGGKRSMTAGVMQTSPGRGADLVRVGHSDFGTSNSSFDKTLKAATPRRASDRARARSERQERMTRKTELTVKSRAQRDAVSRPWRPVCRQTWL
jgi:hypothetical protein